MHNMINRERARVVRGLALVAVLVACSSDKSSGPAKTIAVSATPATLTVQQGGSGTVALTLTRGGGFSADVSLSVTGLPTGVTTSIVPAQLTGSTTSATVTVNVDATVAPGNYTATVHGTATGVGEATATYQLTVTAIPNYTLSATPAAVSVPKGLSGTTTIGIVRTNFTGGVTLVLDNPPAGITGTFNPTPATGDNSQLTINVATTVANGSYNLTVKGSAAGPGDKTVTVALTVSDQPDYTLSATPNALTITAGANATTTVNIARTNFTGAVTLALDSPPAGVTAAFNPAAPTGTSSVATISVAASVAPGNYTLTIKGTATGVPTVIDAAGNVQALSVAPGDRETTVALTVGAAPNFSLAASPNAIAVQQGQSGNTTVNITRTNFTGDIALSLDAPPAGITGTFTPATATGNTSALKVDVASTVPVGQYQLTIKGSATGPGDRNTTLAVTVVAGPTVTLAMNPATLSIEQGASGQSTLTATRAGYNGTITPSVAGNPAGMTVTFNPNPLTANTSTVTVAVAGSVALGQYTLTITGASGVAGNPTTQLVVSVTAPTGSSFTYEFCDLATAPLRFWKLSGGNWSEVTPTVVGTVTRYTFTISGTNGGIAYTLDDNASVRTRTFSGIRSDAIRREALRAQAKMDALRRKGGMVRVRSAAATSFTTVVQYALTSTFGGVTCGTPPTTANIAVTTVGHTAAEEGSLGVGGIMVPFTAGTTSYNAAVAPGTWDALAIWGPTPSFPTLAHAPSNYNLKRAQAAPGSITVDRNAASALVQSPFSITGGQAGAIWGFVQDVSGARGPIGSWQLDSPLNSTGTGNMFYMQPGDRLASDINALNYVNIEQSGSVLSLVSATRYLGSAPGSASFALNQAVPAFNVVSATGTTLPNALSGNTPTDYQGANSLITAVFISGTSNNSIEFIAPRDWLNANGFQTSYVLGGLSLPNFDAAWTLTTPYDTPTVLMFSGNFTTTPTTGSVILTAIRSQ